MARRTWDESSLRARASEFESKIAFMRGDVSAYNTLRKRFPGALDELFENQREHWTAEKIIKASRGYPTKSMFQRMMKGATIAAYRHHPGLLDVLYDNEKHPGYSEVELADLIATCSDVRDLLDKNPSAYGAARKRYPWLLCDLPNRGCWSSDNDILYLWRVVDVRYPSNLYKIGVTSARLGRARIAECAGALKVQADVVFMAKVDDAYLLEREALQIGTQFAVGDVAGYSEFRLLEPHQVSEIQRLTTNHRV